METENETMVTARETLDWLIKMAMADGVLTPNETAVLKAFCDTHGIDAEDAINRAKELIDLNTPETELIKYPTRNGLDFEEHVVSYLLGVPGLKLLAWTGDKYYKGIYDPTTLNPDLHLCYCPTANTRIAFWVECKWRHHWQKDDRGEYYWEIGARHLAHYRSLARRTRQKVFVVLGTGKNGKNPRSVYLIPLRAFVNGRIYLRDVQCKYDYQDTPLGFINAVMTKFL